MWLITAKGELIGLGKAAIFNGTGNKAEQEGRCLMLWRGCCSCRLGAALQLLGDLVRKGVAILDALAQRHACMG